VSLFGCYAYEVSIVLVSTIDTLTCSAIVLLDPETRCAQQWETAEKGGGSWVPEEEEP